MNEATGLTLYGNIGGYSVLSPRYSVTTRHVAELRQTPTLRLRPQ